MQKTIFVYSWHQIEDASTSGEFKKWTDPEHIRVYGIDENGKSICVTIDDFRPFVHIELPNHIQWLENGNIPKVQKISNYLRTLLGSNAPIKQGTSFKYKYKLYGAHYDRNENGFYRKKFPYLVCKFANRKQIALLNSKLKNKVDVPGFGLIDLKVRETNISPILQLCVEKNLPSSGWLEIQGEFREEDEKVTDCDEEYLVHSIEKDSLRPSDRQCPIKAKIMAWDIESFSVDGSFPDPNIPGNVVFQISCVFGTMGSIKERKSKYLLTLGEPDFSNFDVEEVKEILVRTFKDEVSLLEGFAKLIKEEKPHLITGWNIFNFDIGYLLQRAKLNRCLPNFLLQGFPKDILGKEKTVNWTSKAYGTTDLKFIDSEGVLSIDLMDIVQKAYKLDAYNLNEVSKHFLNSKKDDLDHIEIFASYKIGMERNGCGFTKNAKLAMGKVGKYCVQDSVLVLDLFQHLQTWFSLTEMSKTCSTPIMDIHVRGQQVKFFNQLYKHCFEHEIVVDKEGYVVSDQERYRGAEVLDPEPGLKKNVVSVDFASLYPSLIQAYNLDYSTNVVDKTIPDELCHVMKWEDHVSCEHDPKIIRKKELTVKIDELKRKIKDEKDRGRKDKLKIDLASLTKERSNITKKLSKSVMCAKRSYRFLKEPRGVLPTIIKDLLDARKNTRAEIKIWQNKLKSAGGLEEQEIAKSMIQILDQRQNSYKVSANSMYGATGVRVGALPFMPIAMCTTYMGRKSILEVVEHMKDYGGTVVYGDTDCLCRTTPVLIRKDDSDVFFTTVDELSKNDWEYINPNKDISSPKENYEIWSDTGFTKIENVVRCKIDEPLKRVTTHVGSVICSDNHSLLTENLTGVTPNDVVIGDRLCVRELPLPQDTPQVPIYINRLTAERIQMYEIPEVSYLNVSAKMAFVWGLFFADGGAGIYKQSKSNCLSNFTWAINKADIALLERARELLEGETNNKFKILDTIESSKCYKLVFCHLDRKMVEEYIEMFYDKDKNKTIPHIILQAPFLIRQAFFMGYYAGDGSKKDPAICLSNKGQLGSAQLFYLMRSIGYNVSVNVREDKPHIYKLTGSTPECKQRKIPNAIKKITSFSNDGYIYDIQTENHHFAAGVGQLVVHNSNYVTFDGIVDRNVKVGTPEFTIEMKKLWAHAIYVAKEISKKFPEPITLEFENAIYFKFLILTKKRYMYYSCGEEGNVKMENNGLVPKMGKRGVLLSRRDNCKFMKKVYSEVIDKIFSSDEINSDDILNSVIDHSLSLYQRRIEFCGAVEKDKDVFLKDLIVTKSVGDYGGENPTFIPELGKNDRGETRWKIGAYIVNLITDEDKANMTEDQIKDWYLEQLPGQVQLQEKIKKRGHAKEEGQRLAYVVTDIGRSAKQSEKIESDKYFFTYSHILKLDYGYYIDRLVEPLDQVFQAVFHKEAGISSYRKHNGYSPNFIKNFPKLYTIFVKRGRGGLHSFTKDFHKVSAVLKPKLLKELQLLTKPELSFD
ncbi:delta DNA polymerase (B family) [Armadillidium vulgare iridescent virus]|uniref:DNA polymerase n=2 Tax=Invertebrate iridescent virus 31 TaxID=345199 RepID=A0A068QKL8_9VIRU|nr:delta DNA polymerase (B family) [Armadillidium vulgare iridescent virus]CCA64446.1 delta DNA polymerase B [Invertebrate iridescent virus 31]CCV02373.1 delta DNA polymerase (B family) [Armadillidium vulgare iridescent virus]